MGGKFVIMHRDEKLNIDNKKITEFRNGNNLQ